MDNLVFHQPAQGIGITDSAFQGKAGGRNCSNYSTMGKLLNEEKK
jgi:hypothetical protein